MLVSPAVLALATVPATSTGVCLKLVSHTPLPRRTSSEAAFGPAGSGAGRAASATTGAGCGLGATGGL
ncbi:MAG: hypothetical protein JWN08_1227, partial [Frankiales bacterium]|nr:hypothetical protein [Frankiales bacterium]